MAQVSDKIASPGGDGIMDVEIRSEALTALWIYAHRPPCSRVNCRFRSKPATHTTGEAEGH